MNKKKNNFVVISNKILHDERLSLDALGLLCTLIADLPEWDGTEAGLLGLSRDDAESIHRSIQELQAIGYISFDDNGFIIVNDMDN